MKIRLVFVILVALAGAHTWLGNPSVAYADEDEDSLNRAKAAFNEGQNLFVKERFVQAAGMFEEAYAQRAIPAFLYNIALSYQKARCYARAIKYYEQYLVAEKKPKDRVDVNNKIDVLKEAARTAGTAECTEQTIQQVKETAKVEALNKKDQSVKGLVIIESEPPGAKLYFNDKSGEPELTPWNGELEGEVTIIIEKDGYKPVPPRKLTVSKDRINVWFINMAEQDYLGWVEIASNVPGADIYIDDKAEGVKGKTPWSGNMQPGKHKIWVDGTRIGYDEYFEEVEVVAGSTHKVTATLEGTPVGFIDMRGRAVENMGLYVDGELLCETGPCKKPVPEGPHKISIKRKGYKTYSRDITIQAGTVLTVRPNLAEQPGRGDAVAAYVFSGVFLAGGITLGVLANGIDSEISDDIEAGMPPPDPNDSRFTKGKIFAIAANGAFAVAGVSLLTAVYYTFRDKGEASTASTDVRALSWSPRLGPDYAGVGMEVRW